MHVDLELLKTFITFVESSNILEAANKLHLSQPAVSIQLKKLETFMPNPMFSTQGKRKILSHYGQEIYKSLKGKLTEINNSIDQVNLRFSSPENIKIRIGARKELFPKIVENINFNSNLKFIDVTSLDALKMLLNHELEIAVTHKIPDRIEIISKKLFSDGSRLCISKKLLGGKEANINTIKSESFLLNTPAIAYKEEAPFLFKWAEHCHFPTLKLPIKIVCEDWRTIHILVKNGVGYSIIPENAIINDEEIETIPIPKSVLPETNFYFLYHSDLKPLKAIRDLFKQIKT